MKAKKICGIVAGCFIFFEVSFSQGVTIGANSTPAGSAILDLRSTSKGFLPPRMTGNQRKAIASPIAGLVVYDTDQNQLFLYDGSVWTPLVGGTSGNILYPLSRSQPTADQKAGGYFGIKVDISGNYAIAGAPRSDVGTATNSGAVYVYKKSGTGAWTQVAKLVPSDPQASASFGASLAIDGSYIVIGAPLFDNTSGTDAGKVYVFKKGSGDNWSQQTYFEGTAAYDYFGYNVDLSAATTNGAAFVVGTPGSDANGTDRGAAYAYRLNGTTWQYVQTILPADRLNGDRFGWEVSIDTDYCAISAPLQDNTTYADAGAVYIYVFGGGTWTFQQKLNTYTTGAEFGFGISLKGSWLAVGAPLATPYSNTSAAVYIYARSGATWSQKTSVYLLNSQGYDNSNRFGVSVGIDGEKLLISAPAGYLTHFNSSSYYYKNGSVFVYKLYGNTYRLEKIINDDDPLPPYFSNNFFGNSLSIDKGNYILGSPGKFMNGVASGAIAFGYVE